MSRVVLGAAVAIVTLLGSHTLPGQQTGAQVSLTAPLESQYVGDLTELHDKVLALAEAIPADRYMWRPSDQVRTVSQLLMHISGEWYYLCPVSVGGKPPAPRVVLLVSGDQHEHLGQLIAFARSIGVKPPWSK